VSKEAPLRGAFFVHSETENSGSAGLKNIFSKGVTVVLWVRIE
jgi:hypothetical protein